MIAISFLVSLLVGMATSIFQPRELTCPPKFFVNGVRPSGVTSCISTWDPRPDTPNGGNPPPIDVLRIRIQIFCNPDEQPLVINERRVACRRKR